MSVQIRYGSVCSGIEAATVAWHPLGWIPVWFSEIEKFPCAVLSHHYPSVPNLGDMTKIHESEVFKNDSIDLLVGGTPCQSFSVAGLRKGLADPRGSLALVYLSIADRAKPRWVVWENVPGVLSSGEGRDFGAFLGGLAELGYGWAYRVLDAQYFGVPQRRRRVFVVGYLGDWRPPAAVLFERHSLQGHNPPSREKREGSPACFTTSPDGSGKPDDGSPTLDARAKDGPRANTKQNGTPLSEDKAHTLDCGSPQAVAFTQNTRDEVRQIGGDGGISGALGASDGMKQKTYLAVPRVYENHPADSRMKECGDVAPTVTSRFGTGGGNVPIVNEPMTFTPAEARRSGTIQSAEVTQQVGAVHSASMQVRRLTPRECERLQGFPDDYTLIRLSSKGKFVPLHEIQNTKWKLASDGPRYKALGNSMAVPVMAWIGIRIAQVESLIECAS